jgi:cytidylate kinase
MKVAIDGPAGCGKSTIARMIADNFGFLYINSGNLYRAVTCLALQEKVSWQDSPAMIALVQRHRFDYLPDGSVDIDGKRLAGELRTPEVDAIVSQVSAIPEIRSEVNSIIRSISEGKDVVSEGRDITTVVFPDAGVKLYLDASPQVRAERRFREMLALQAAGGFSGISPKTASIEEIRKNIEMRDRLDAQKAVGALKIAKDAVYLDTSDLTIQQVYEKVYKILRARIAHGRK